MKKKEQDLVNEINLHSKTDERFLITSSYLLELANRDYELFISSQPAQKNKLLKFVLANLKLEGEKLVGELKKPFEGILKCNERQEWLPRLEDVRTLMAG